LSLQPDDRRALVQDEAASWQQLSQYGADAEHHATPSLLRRNYRLNGKLAEVPERRRRVPPPNRLLEIHGLAGAIGEQLGLAWTAEQGVQRFRSTGSSRSPEHQHFVQRALPELAGHFVLGIAHSLGNFTLRLLLLNDKAADELNRHRPKAAGFPPGSDDPTPG
jgi:hypothetical protein